MAGALIGALRVSLSAETSAFEAGMKKSQKQAATTASSIQTSFSKAGNALKSNFFGINSFLSALSVGVIIQAGRAALEYAGSLGEVAQQLGVTTRDLQTFRYAAGQVGVGQEQLETGLSKLTITLGKLAAGAEAPAKALKAIGISADELKGKDTGEAFRIIADGLEKIPDRAQRAAVEVALFGKSGAMLDNLLSGGSKSVNELAKAAEELGIVLSDEQIQKADDTADKLAALQTVLKAKIAGEIADNSNAILQFANALFELARAAGQARQFLADLERNWSLPALLFKATNNFKAQGFGVAGNAVKVPLGRGGTADEEARRRGLKLASDVRVKGNSIGDFLAKPARGGKPKKDHSAEDALRKQIDGLRDANSFDQDIRRAKIDVLNSEKQLSKDYVERRNISIQILEAERASFDAQLAYDVKLNELTKGEDGRTAIQAQQLSAEQDKLDALEVQALNEEEQAQRREDVARLADLDYDLERERLENVAALADTASEARDAAMRLLDLDYRHERAKLDAIMAEEEIGWLAWEEARRRKAALDEIYAGRRAAAKAGTRGPLEEFGSSLPLDADKLNEALENVAVDGLKSLEDGLMDVISGTKSVKEAFHDMAAAILADLIRIAIQKYIIGTIMQVAGLGGTGGGMADGGLVPAFASGGFVSGPGGPKEDRVPAMLSAGEFVINAASTRKFLPFLHALNEGNIQHRKGGGGIFSKMFGGSFGSLALGLSGGMFGKASSGLSAVSFGAVGKLFGFAEGGLVPKGLPIAQASYGPRVSATQNNLSVTPVSLTFHNDFRGADASAVASIEAKLNKFQAEFPGKVVATMQDAKERLVWRGDRR